MSNRAGASDGLHPKAYQSITAQQMDRIRGMLEGRPRLAMWIDETL
jgi:hypothetical protein